MSDMIEKVARAICQVHLHGSTTWTDYIYEAKAAIEAMLEDSDLAIYDRRTGLSLKTTDLAKTA